MLGIWMSPSNDESKLINELRSKAMGWGAKIRQGNPSHFEAWTALHTNMLTRLKYPLPACTLSKQFCGSIMFLALRSGLPKSGICATIASDIRHGL